MEKKCKTKAPASPENKAADKLDKAATRAKVKVQAAKSGKTKANPKSKGKSSMKALQERLRIARQKRQIADDELEIAHAEVAKVEIETGKKPPLTKTPNTNIKKKGGTTASSTKSKRAKGIKKKGKRKSKGKRKGKSVMAKLQQNVVSAAAAYENVRNGSHFSSPEYVAKHHIPAQSSSNDNARCSRCKNLCRKNPGCLAQCFDHEGPCDGGTSL